MAPRFDVAGAEPAALARSLRLAAWDGLCELYPRVASHDLGRWLPDANASAAPWPDNRPQPIGAFRRLYARIERVSTAPRRRALEEVHPLEIAVATGIARTPRRRARRAKLNGGRLPEFHRFYASIAATAFAETSFRIAVATYLRRALESRVVFHPEPPPRIVLADATFVILMHLHTSGRPPAKSATNLDAIAVLHASSTELANWAGFWDQFVLKEAMDRFGRRSDTAEVLPLVEHGLDAFSLSPTLDVAAARPGWRGETPSYGHRLLDGLP